MTLPSSIGRYQVLGHLATGGMAEILLGKLFGPSGFEQVFVVKRCLPHLARRPEFVSMFLDEARILAGIRHPNVVRVIELGQDGAELFLVMDYLAGESVQAIIRRMVARRRPMGPLLSSHVAAEACAGLHAAHELTDDRGRRQNVVHRDISPQNVFATYAGEVKLLDFGVAIAADRIARTNTGEVKGKFAYMSPEQCRGATVDRRSDIFSMGIVLYELTTGRRLFARATELLTMQAICDQPVVPPSAIAPGYPARLEAIVLRALAREPGDRYATAAELRHDLLAAQQALGGALAPEEELSRFLNQIFEDRIAEKRDMVARVRAGSVLEHIPVAEPDPDVDVPSVATVPLRRARRRSGFVVVAAAAVAVAAVATSIALALPGGSSSTAAIGEPITPAAPIAPADARASTPDAGTPATVSFDVSTAPTGAAILIDGRPAGRSPAVVAVPRGDAPVRVEVQRDGYAASGRPVVPDGDRTLHFAMRRSAEKRSSHRKRPPRGTAIERFE